MQHKIAILVPTYQRKTGVSPNILGAMFDMLSKQIIPANTAVTLFVIGDCYENDTEFRELCNNAVSLLANKITVTSHNCDIHFRNGYFKHCQNNWCMGGINAVVTGLQMIKDGGFDYHFHLDDDDYWYPEYIKYAMNCLEQYPESAFTICKAHYLNNIELPKATITELFYNNYLIKPCDSVHASWIINMNLIGAELLAVYTRYLNQVLLIKSNPESEILFKPCDSLILAHFRVLQRTNKINAMCLPIKHVKKETEYNNPT
jgi:hypothetical protein